MLTHLTCCSQFAPCAARASMVALVFVPSMCPCLCLLYCVLCPQAMSTLQACRHSEEGAAAVATAAAHAVTGPSSPESLRTAASSRRDQVGSVASSLESVASATSGGSTRVSPGGMADSSSGLGTRSSSQSPVPHSMSMFYGGNAAGHSHFGQPAGASTGFPALGNGTFSSNGLLGGSGLLSNGSRHSSSNGLHHLW